MALSITALDTVLQSVVMLSVLNEPIMLSDMLSVIASAETETYKWNSVTVNASLEAIVFLLNWQELSGIYSGDYWWQKRMR